MRLVEFLVYLLQAHGQTLGRLAAFFGEERFIEMLEEAGEELGEGQSGAMSPSKFAHASGAEVRWLDPSHSGTNANAYTELEGAIRDMNLPSVLEFHLWAYPHYREFIESSLELNARIKGPGYESGAALVDEACQYAEAWVKRLHIPPTIAPQAERAAQIPWLRFRAEVLKRIGKRPLGPVY